MSKHKKQHFVAQSYLRAWCDPETPADQEPYVWRFSKDGTNARRKAPENIFHETDLYTITMPDGGRNLRLGHGLSQLESEFVKIREAKLARQRRLACPCRYAHQATARAAAPPETGPVGPPATPSIRCPINASDGISERYFATCDSHTGWSASARSVCSRSPRHASKDRLLRPLMLRGALWHRRADDGTTPAGRKS